MTQRTSLILGNWKMNGRYDDNSELINQIVLGLNQLQSTSTSTVQVGVCVPFVYLSHIEDVCFDTKLRYGAQDCSAYAQGAYTGDVSALMLSEFAVHYVLVGHSERRLYQGETSETIGLKVQQALKSSITPVLCIGETLQHRENNQTLNILKEQLSAVIKVVGVDAMQQCVIAYEPVWAIGTGLTATPEQAQTVHAAIRTWLKEQGVQADAIQLLYGGSMKPDNAAALLAQPDIDGGLIGGAALKASDFLAIINQAA